MLIVTHVDLQIPGLKNWTLTALWPGRTAYAYMLVGESAEWSL